MTSHRGWLRRFALVIAIACLCFFGSLAEAAPKKPEANKKAGATKGHRGNRSGGPSSAKMEPAVDPMRHEIMILGPKNFDSSIHKYLDKFPAGVLFYKPTENAKTYIDGTWDAVAKNLNGMVKVGAVNCDEHATFCKSQDVTLNSADYLIKIYPPMPQPARIYEGEKTSTKLTSFLTKLIPKATIKLIATVDEMQSFVGKNPSIPKVLLFTDKQKASPMFNALAHSFEDRVSFGMVTGALGSPLHSKFHVKKLPALIVKRNDMTVSARNAEQYRGELRFRAVHDWINVHSETFVKGGGFSSEKEPAEMDMTNLRPWLTQRIPELTKASHQDVCFKKQKGLCVVYLTDKEELSADELQMLEDLSEKFAPETKPGFHWMWMRINREVNFAKLLKFTKDAEEPRKLPSLVIFNPHNRIRFSQLPANQVADKTNLDRFVERIISGDGRFTMIKGNKIPAFISRGAVHKEDEPDKNKEEL